MREHAERFTGRVEVYERYRTRYPRAVLAWLRTACGLTTEWAVADVGAGTGMLAELLLENGNTVTAVEPNAEMRAVCEAMGARYPRLRVVDGTAERTGLDGESMDLVSVGRAFHWFEPVGAAAEFRRVLRPGGWVVIASSGRERSGSSELGMAFQELLLRYGTDAKHVRSWRERAEKSRDFLRALGAGVDPVTTEFATERGLTLEEFLGETQSLSVAPLPGTAEYPRMRAALEAFFAEWSVDGRLPLRSVCIVGAARVHGKTAGEGTIGDGTSYRLP